MISPVWVDPRIQSVKAPAVRSYMLRRGWRLEPYPGPELMVFGGLRNDDRQPITQVVPSSEQMRDFRLHVEELIAALSVFEDRPPTDILTDMLREGPSEQPPPAAAVNEPSTPVAPA